MAVKHLISPGIGFSPGSVKYIVTRGLFPGAVLTFGGERAAFARYRDAREYVIFQDKRSFSRFRDKRELDNG